MLANNTTIPFRLFKVEEEEEALSRFHDTPAITMLFCFIIIIIIWLITII